MYDHKTFTPENIDEILEYPMSGGGGTMFECVFEFLKKEEIEPNKLVFFTDGYPCGTWGDEDYCDTLFIIHGSHSIVPPFWCCCALRGPQELMFNAAASLEAALYKFKKHNWELWFAWFPVRCEHKQVWFKHVWRKRHLLEAKGSRGLVIWLYQTPDQRMLDKLKS